MTHWNWQSVAAVVTLGVLLLGLGFRGFRYLVKQNNDQLAEARRIKREVFGEDPDDPNGPKGPTIRALLNQVVDQTRPLAATVEEHGRRLGKAEDQLGTIDSRLTEVERVVLRRVDPL